MTSRDARRAFLKRLTALGVAGAALPLQGAHAAAAGGEA